MSKLNEMLDGLREPVEEMRGGSRSYNPERGSAGAAAKRMAYYANEAVAGMEGIDHRNEKAPPELKRALDAALVAVTAAYKQVRKVEKARG
jgi:hypothetical protein